VVAPLPLGLINYVHGMSTTFNTPDPALATCWSRNLVSISLYLQGLEDLRESRRVNELARKRPQLRQRVADSIKNKRYTYAPYGITFSTKTNHENHLKTQNHREQASRTAKTPPRRYRHAYLRRPPTSRRRDIAVLFATMLLEHRNYSIIISTRSSITRGSS
jgi:hypothetical protein